MLTRLLIKIHLHFLHALIFVLEFEGNLYDLGMFWQFVFLHQMPWGGYGTLSDHQILKDAAFLRSNVP